MLKTKDLIPLLQELINARGPCGQEDDVRMICLRELKKCCDKVWTDEAGNTIGLMKGKTGNSKSKQKAPVIRVLAHMDEISMIVKRINKDGSLRVNNMGGLNPGYFGQGPVDIMADNKILPGILSLGPGHTTKETPNVEATKTKRINMEYLYVFTGKKPGELKKLGVHAGTRVVISQTRRKLFHVEDCIGGYFMDDRAAIVISLASAMLLRQKKKRPLNDVYFAMTVSEEIGAVGGAYASHTLPGNVSIAVDVGPVADEYGTKLNDQPIIVYRDTAGLYTKTINDRMLACAKKLKMDVQCAIWESYGSDATISWKLGHTAQAGLICIATDNTHGYEIIPKKGLMTCARLLAAYLEEPI